MVGGPPGAGAREIAIGLAADRAAQGSTVLVDCSESVAGCGAPPRVAVAAPPPRRRSPRCGGRWPTVRGAAGRRCRGRRPLPFDVICGLASPSDWQRLTPADADAVLAACAEQWSCTVVVTSPIIEDLGRWVNRYAVSRHLLGVGRGVGRRVRGDTAWCVALRRVAGRLPSRSAGSCRRQQGAEVRGSSSARWSSSCARCAVSASRSWRSVPFDRRVSIAEWDAALPAKGAFTRAVATVAVNAGRRP